MEAMRAFPLLAGTLLLLAGCMSASNTSSTTGASHGGAVVYPDERYTAPFDSMPDGAGHDHADPGQHKFLWNYAFSARDPLMANAANAAGIHAMDLQNGWLFGAVYGSHTVSVDGGMQIWDVHSDPAHPKEMGRWIIPGSVGGDRSIGATPDGDYVVLGTEYVDCLGHINPAGAAFTAYLLDTRNKNQPLVADVLLASGGTLGDPTNNRLHSSTHSVFVHRINGLDYAFIFGDIYQIVRAEDGTAKLVASGTVSTGHDLYVRDTPWNTTWSLSANGGGGVSVVDVTDPSKPFDIGTWDIPNRTELEAKNGGYYVHTVDVAFIGDQTLVVVASEDFVPDPQHTHPSPFWVLDGNALKSVQRGSEPIQMTQLGEWHNPGNHSALNIRFSLHNQRLHDGGLMTISSYHAGWFQFDLRNPAFWSNPSLIAMGAYADGAAPVTIDPVESTVENQLCKLGVTVDAPEQMDVAVGPNGVLYLADVFMGLYTFTPTADHPIYGSHRTLEYSGQNTPGLL